MKVRTFGIAAGSIVAMCGLVIACSDDSSTGSTSGSSSGGSSGTTSSGGSSGTSSSGGSSGTASSSGGSSGSTTNQCELAPGTYTVKTTRKSGDAVKCPEPAPYDLEIKASDGGAADAGSDCTIKTDTTTCVTTTDCTTKTAGYTTTTKGTFNSKDLTGTTASKTVKDSDMSVLSECEYTYTWTKK
jgi:hypothetical protein